MKMKVISNWISVDSNVAKVCVSCKTLKTIDHYASRGNEKLHNTCKQCQAEYGRKHYQANKAIYNDRARKNEEALIKRNQDFIRAYKENKPCTDCGKQYPYYVMDFDHLDPTKKEKNVGRLTARSFSLEKIQKEIDKCELVCSNCHRIRTHNRRVALVAEQE